MAGQIIKRGDKNWLVRIFMGRDAQGKRRYLNTTVRGTKRDANDYLSKTLTAISTGSFVARSPVTVSEYLDKWLETAARGRVRTRTFTDYSELLARHVRPSLGAIKLTELRPLDIQALYTKMQDNGLSPRTIRYVHAVLSSALKQAVRWFMLAQNPATLVDLPKMTRKEMQALSVSEVERFMKAAAADRWHPIFA